MIEKVSIGISEDHHRRRNMEKLEKVH